MFDEPGIDYKPLPPSRTRPTPPEPAAPPETGQASAKPEPAQSQPGESAFITTLTRPLWLRLTNYLLIFVLVTRLFAAFGGGTALAVLVQLGNVVILGIIIFGLAAVRRWAAIMFIMFCTWMVISVLVVSVNRLRLLDEVVENDVTRVSIQFATFVNIVLAVLFFGGMGIWYGYNLKRFPPSNDAITRNGNLAYVIVLGLLILFTATQIADTRAYLRDQADQYEESRGLVEDLLG